MSEPTMRSTQYIPEASNKETARLRKQGLLYRDATQSILAKAGVDHGNTVLDLGCGGGDLMELLAARVGTGGAITGVDQDAEVGAAAASRVGRQQGLSVEFIAGLLPNVPELRGRAYDVVASRFLTVHLGEPIRVLEDMLHWTRPGGVLVLMELDFVTVRSAPQSHAVELFRRVASDVYATAGLDLHHGAEVPSLLRLAAREHGLNDPRIESWCVAPSFQLADAADALASQYVGFCRAATRLGLSPPLDEVAYQTLVASEATDAAGHFFICPMLVGTWLRLPP